MRLIKTTLPDRIFSLKEAKAYLTDLYNNDEIYHPDDDAADCLPGIHEQDAHHMDFIMGEVFKFFQESGDDVYLFILELGGHKIED